MAAWIELHDLEGQPIMVQLALVECFSSDPDLMKIYKPGAKTVLYFSSGRVPVTEAYDEVVRCLVGHV